MAGMERLCGVGRGSVWRGRRGGAWPSGAELGKAGMARCGLDWSGVAWQGRHGEAKHGEAGQGSDRQAFNKEKLMDAERKLLERMARRNGGVLMIDDVIMEAADESSILHSHFEWDDTEAAISYRRDQARTLIQRCRITVLADEPTHIRAFVSLPSDRSTGGGYRLVVDVMTDDTMKEEFIHDLKLTIARWTKKLHLIDSDIADLIVKLDYEIKQRSKAQEEARA